MYYIHTISISSKFLVEAKYLGSCQCDWVILFIHKAQTTAVLQSQ